MKISYLVTVHNEDASLQKCITTIVTHKDDEDEILILDDFSDNPKTKEILANWQNTVKLTARTPAGDMAKVPNVRVIQHALDRNYGAHKNFGNEQCTGDWIFQIDGDEIPNPNLIVNLKTIIESNPAIDLIYVPRINDFVGVTPEHAAQWGWRLTPCPACDNRPVVNWPDYQSRIYRRDPSRIRWDRRLHEKIEGHNQFTTLPDDTDLALYHDKSIDTQMKTNNRYNEWFTQEENRGHNVFGSSKVEKVDNIKGIMEIAKSTHDEYFIKVRKDAEIKPYVGLTSNLLLIEEKKRIFVEYMKVDPTDYGWYCVCRKLREESL